MTDGNASKIRTSREPVGGMRGCRCVRRWSVAFFRNPPLWSPAGVRGGAPLFGLASPSAAFSRRAGLYTPSTGGTLNEPGCADLFHPSVTLAEPQGPPRAVGVKPRAVGGKRRPLRTVAAKPLRDACSPNSCSGCAPGFPFLAVPGWLRPSGFLAPRLAGSCRRWASGEFGFLVTPELCLMGETFCLVGGISR